jgi:hypothetical protein
MSLQTILPQLVVGLLLAAAMYVFSGRLHRLETRSERTLEQLAALAGQVAALPTRQEFDARFDKVDARFDKVDARFERVDSRFERIDGQMASLRSDLTQIALVVGARTRPQTG